LTEKKKQFSNNLALTLPFKTWTEIHVCSCFHSKNLEPIAPNKRGETVILGCDAILKLDNKTSSTEINKVASQLLKLF